MREIKFRAWHAGNEDGKGGFVKGHEPQMLYDVKSGDCLVWQNQGQNIADIMQFTGLFDRLLTKIFEGDICRFDVTELQGRGKPIKGVIGEAKWDDEDAGFYFLTNTDKFPHVKPWSATKIEIIGNVHENPELLEPQP